MGQGVQYPIQLLGGRKRCSDVQWWLCRGSLMYRSCGNHSQLQHTLRANCNGHEGRLKRKYSIADPVQLPQISVLHSIRSHPIDLGRRRHLRRQRSIRVSRDRTDQLWCGRQSGLERERSMVKRPSIRHQLRRRTPHVASRPPTNDRRRIRHSRLYLRASVELQPIRRETQLSRPDTMATCLRRSEQPVLSSLRGSADAGRRLRGRR